MGIAICTKNTEKAVEKEMWRVCEVCKYKHLQEVERPCEYMQYGECTYSETGCGDCKAKLKALGYLKEVENDGM